ncbi:MAG: heparinase II/III family protein [Undibacterium sp.]|nr:heparinase II/III family protein [Opitutaceae bacterium]
MLSLPRLSLALGFTFAVALGAHAASFPKPDPEKQFADIKVLDAQGHPWRSAIEDWPGAKQRVASDPAWSQWLAGERKTVDSWMAKHLDRVEWIAGWSHDGVSPKDGSALTWNAKIPGEEAPFLSSPSDPEVAITPKLMAWWVVSFRDKHVETMQRAARLWRLTGDGRFAEWVERQMDFYADNYLKWEPVRADQGARLFWQSLTEATNLIKFTEAVRLLGDHVPAAQRAHWREKFFQPEVAVLNKNFQAIHNIATWQRSAVAQVALLYGDEAMWRDAIGGNFGLRRQMAEGITSDYLWYEQSLGYNSYVVAAVNTLFTVAGLYGRADELAAEMATAENLMLATLYLRFPNGQLPNPADTKGIPTAPNRASFAANYRVFPTTLGLAEAAGRRDWDTLLDPPPPAPRPFVLPTISSRSFESSRMAVLKSGSWQVFFHYGQLTKSHSQAEALNYSAFFGDTDITHDPGVVGYGSPLYKAYYQRGLNHNVPLVNGEGQEPISPGELLSFSPTSVSAAQSKYRKDARARRTLSIEGNQLIDTATVESTASTPQKLGLAIQLQGKVRLPESFVAGSTLKSGRPEPFGYWRDVRSASYHDRAEFDVVYGNVIMRVTIATPGDFKLWHASTPDVPPKRRESFYVETTGTSATFTTTFTPR